MTVKDINDIIKAVCPNDEDFEKPCISPKYLRQELEQLALDQRQWNEEPTTKNDLGVDCISRDAVKYYIQAHIHEIITESGIDKNAHTNGILRALLNGVATMPSVTPQLSSELAKNSKKLEKDFGELDCIDRAELLKAMDTWDKFGNDPNIGLIRLITPALQDRYVLYVKYDDMVKCVKGMSSVTPSINNSSECIDKDLAVDCIDRNSIKYYPGHGGYMYASKGEIDKLPLVTPRPRNGHWILRNSFLVPYKCSKCNYESERYDNYCPNCGADMEEVEE